ncbi:PilN domain-containing protein [Inquilinus sp. NPDC058860]|uniref:PilN domain-containing protein n=1 Tax=Inquilinus sp. NPDC058860 TaxID=3346652 RepID=UPI00369CD70D
MALAVSIDALTGAVARAFGWWSRQLRTFLPERLTGAIGPRHRQPVAEAIDGDLFVTEAGHKRRAADWAPRSGRRTVVLRVPGEWALKRTFLLPRMAAPAVPGIARLEMDRLTPWAGAQVFLDSRVARLVDGGRKIEAAITIVPCAKVESLRQRLAEHGLRIAAIELDAQDGGGRQILMPPSGQADPPSQTRSLRRAAAAVAAAMLLLAVGAAGVLGWQIRERERAIDAARAQLAALQPDVEAVRQLQGDIRALREAQRFVDDRRRQTPAASIVLEAVTRILPDDVWLTELVMSGGALRLAGYAADASMLIGSLESSSDFHDAKFQAPSTRDRELGKDRFAVGADIRPRLEP